MAENSQKAANKQRGPGRPFQPGQSGNPGGRPKGIVAAIKEQVGEDGGELVKIAWAIAKGESRARGDKEIYPSIGDSMDAIRWLGEHGFVKPTAKMEVAHSFADLTDEQLEARKLEIITKALAERDAG